MIQFKEIKLENKKEYEHLLHSNIEHGCEYSFTNLFMWGTQQITFMDNHVLLFSEFDNHCFYPFPVGHGDKKKILDQIFDDADERGISCCLTGLNYEDKQTLETLYPGKFYFHADRSNFDYVYDINCLADLKGRKLHRKRNHLKHFEKTHPDCVVEPICDENLDEVRTFISQWYQLKLKDAPDGDYHNEQAALEKALTFHKELHMEGLLLREGSQILAFTLGSQMSSDTFDVHFEKARGDIDGAYTTINSAFANYIRTKHPHIAYLNREEDMGIPGLRKAKQSYFPHHLIKKYKAFPIQYQFAYSHPNASHIPALRTLWKEAFGDSDAFLNSFFSTAFDSSRCRIATIDHNIAAVLYWFDCTINGQDCAYIYAVATSMKYRGNGACHMLLANTHELLKEKGYHSTILVPGSEKLIILYEGSEYETCTRISELKCCAEDMHISVEEITQDDFAGLRPTFLPKDSVLQEKENLNFLSTQAQFYKGENFLLVANIENENLFGIELLGDTSVTPGILHALGCKDGTFRIPGKDIDFAMYHRLSEDAVEPEYFGFAFD